MEHQATNPFYLPATAIITASREIALSNDSFSIVSKISVLPVK